MTTMTTYLVIVLLYMSMSFPSRANVSLQQGDLSKVNSSEALLSMSGDSMHKLPWWQNFHPELESEPEAFLRYLISSPLPENQLEKYENSPGCDKDYLQEIVAKQGLLATRDLSIAEFQSEENIKSVGNMKVTMWMLAFVCLTRNEQACESLAPVILQSTPHKLDGENQQWSDFRPTYFTLWEVDGAGSTAVSNSVPPRIPIVNDYVKNGTSDQLRILPWENVQYCGELGLNFSPGKVGQFTKAEGTETPALKINRALDAGFHNYSSKCYTMGEDFAKATGSSSLLVLGSAFLPQYVTDLSRCSSNIVPVLFSNTSGFYACLQQTLNSVFRFSCAKFDCDEASVKASLVPYFDAVYKASRTSNDTTIKLADGQTCSTDPSSAWLQVRAEYRPSVNYTPPFCEKRRAAKEHLCLLGIDPSENFLTTNSEVTIVSSFLSRVKNSYIQAHASALNLDQGPPTDFWLAFISLPSSFFAVIAGVVPLTDAQLRLVNKLKLKPSKRLITTVLCFCNILLAFISYSAVIALTPAELQRLKKFSTWAIHTDQVQVTSTGLRVLIFIQGESEYWSGSLIVAWLSTVVLMPLVAFITYWRTCRRQEVGTKVVERKWNRSYTK